VNAATRYPAAAAGLLRPAWHACKIGAAMPYRGVAGRVCFVGVTGSCGKTTTVELTTAILASQGKVRKGSGLTNPAHRVAGTILTTMPWFRFSVIELGGFEPGALARSCRVLRPDIGVVTAVCFDHLSAFRDLDKTAAEKSSLVRALGANGTAVLNADDERVLAMKDVTRARVLTYGLSADAVVRGEDVCSAWPEPLSLTVAYDGERRLVRTQLLGSHWATSVLAALATGIAAGVSLDEGARAIEEVPPVAGRMSPHPTADGVTFIQDTWKAPLYSIPVVLEFMRAARAKRKVLVIGSISDYRGDNKKRWRDVAQQAAEVVDKVVLISRWAHHGLRGRTPGDDRVLAFDNLYSANRYLREYLEQGDLVLLKGSNRNDHLERLVLDRTSGIDCWRVDCRRWTRCAHCSLRNSPFVPGQG
jgi:UDP-N-acetylmuramyl pentapeptide synthase